MAVKVFILGRPGSGKSAAARRSAKLAQRKACPTIHISDYEVLHRWFLSEQHNPYIEHRYFCPTEHNGFDVIDFSVLHAALEKVEKTARKQLSCAKKLVLIEFARCDYSEVLRTFSNDVLHDAYFLYINSDIDTCIQRVHARTIYPRTLHDHYVSEEIIKSYYQKDNKPYILSQLAKDYKLDNERVKVIDNTGSWLDFLQKVSQFVESIFLREANSLGETLSMQTSLSVQKIKPLQELEPAREEVPSLQTISSTLAVPVLSVRTGSL